MPHDIFKEQRIVIEFLVKSGQTDAEIMPMLNNVYGEVTMKKSAVYDWIQHFWNNWEDMNIETQTPSNIICVKQLLDSDCNLSIKDVPYELSINSETVCLIVKDDLRLWKLCAKLIPRNLTKEQKKRRADVCHD